MIKLQQVCKNQACCNLSLANLSQHVETTCIKPAHNKFWQSTSNGLFVNKPSWYRVVLEGCGKMPTDLLQLAHFWLCIRIANQKSVRYLGIFFIFISKYKQSTYLHYRLFRIFKTVKANDIFYCSMQARHLWESNDLRWAIHVTINLPGY